MSPYFKPDRSNRPQPSQDPFWTHKEGVSENSAFLSDGRPLVTESAYIEGFFIRYYYFDSTDLEEANVQNLRHLLKKSGYSWPDYNEEGTIRTYAKLQKDHQDRSIWEIQVVFRTD